MFQNNWTAFLEQEFAQPYFRQLASFLKQEYAAKKIYPPKSDVFSCFYYTDLPAVKVVIIGQDPYHQPNQAHGMCFSVKPDIAPPPSLQNIYKELHDDLGCYIPNNGYLLSWAQQGVLLLNTVLTVEDSHPLSHRNRGWETFTDHVLLQLNQQNQPIVYLLWGRPAQNKASLLTNPGHLLLKAAHPSPLSAYGGFFGSKPFSQANAYLLKHGLKPINWQIENLHV
ncbi:MAG: uracil-DNA glycosylase [Erysipelotrichaceae bacterium]|nr:uracil-DNA glycosylase [Erysipelotrichaceae bacterium]